MEGSGNPLARTSWRWRLSWHPFEVYRPASKRRRLVPGHAVEMTATLLDRTVARILGGTRIATASLQQPQDLAAVVHLCGSGAGHAYARRVFRLRRGPRCGDHDARRYLAEVNALKRQFARLAASG